MELDDSAFGRAVMNSAVASRLSEELRRLEANPISCVESAKVCIYTWVYMLKKVMLVYVCRTAYGSFCIALT